MESKWIQHNDRSILLVDFRKTKSSAEMIKVLHHADDLIIQKNVPSLILSDFTNCFVSEAFLSEAKSSGQKLGHLYEKMALVGVTGLKKSLFIAYKTVTGLKNHKLFNTVNEAKDWLVE